jgi:hypothetical protein
MILEHLQDSLNVILVVLAILAKNEDVIDVDDDKIVEEWAEDVVHQGPGSCRGVG